MTKEKILKSHKSQEDYFNHPNHQGKDPTQLQYQSMIFVVLQVNDPMKLLDKQSFLPN